MEKKNNRCLITGASGMDASNLIKYLLELGYDVTGTNRRTSSPSDWRHEELGIVDKFKSVSMDLTDSSNVFDVIREGQYDRVFSLGGMSFVSESFNSPLSTVSINTIGHLNILEAVRKYSQHSRIYFAATSEMFGKVQEVPQTETTPFYPRSPYGVSKLASYWLTKNYRESYGLYACSGILFNHEGPLRSNEFVTRKITSNIARIFMEYSLEKTITPFELGNIDAKRDWGNSEDHDL